MNGHYHDSPGMLNEKYEHRERICFTLFHSGELIAFRRCDFPRWPFDLHNLRVQMKSSKRVTPALYAIEVALVIQNKWAQGISDAI